MITVLGGVIPTAIPCEVVSVGQLGRSVTIREKIPQFIKFCK